MQDDTERGAGIAIAGELGNDGIEGANHRFKVSRTPGLVYLKQQLLVARQAGLELLDPAVHLVGLAQVSLESVIERQSELCRRKLRVQTHGFLKFADGFVGQEALLVLEPKLIVAIGFDVRG